MGLGQAGSTAKLDEFKARAEAVLRRVRSQGRTEAANYIQQAIMMLESQRATFASLSPMEQDMFIRTVDARIKQWESGPPRSAEEAASPVHRRAMTSGSAGGLPGWAWVAGGLAVAGGLYYARKKK